MLVGCREQLKIKARINDAAGNNGLSADAGVPVAGLWNFFEAAGVRCAGKTDGSIGWQRQEALRTNRVAKDYRAVPANCHCIEQGSNTPAPIKPSRPS
jgi:hypothetical protein